MAHTVAELEVANRHLAEGVRCVTEQRRRIAEQVRTGRDTGLSTRVLKTFEDTLQLLLEHRDIILRDQAQNNDS